VPVEHVVQEGRLQDKWPLIDAQVGEVHLALEWNPVSLAEDEATAVAAAAAAAVAAAGASSSSSPATPAR
jgi:hypothetical protein